MGKKLKPMLMIMNMLIRAELWHDRKTIPYLLVNWILIIIWEKINIAHEISFAVD